MNTELTIEKKETELQVIALAPDQMAGARTKIMSWCQAKISELVAQREDAQENYDHAIKNRWRSVNFKNQINKYNKLIEYYTKIQAAVGEGYLIVPSFPLNIFAIRTKRSTPTGDSTNSGAWALVQRSQVLPVGEGENRSPQTKIDTYEEECKDSQGQMRTRTHYEATEFMEVEFPTVLVKPEIVERTAEALQKKIFDEMGLVLESGKGDPIVIGRIRHPFPSLEVGQFLYRVVVELPGLVSESAKNGKTN